MLNQMSIMFCWWTSNFFMVKSSERWDGMILPGHASHGPSFKVSAVPAQKHGRQLQKASLKLRHPLYMVSKVWSSFSQFFVWEVIHRIHCLFYFSHTHIPSDYLWQFAMKWLHGHYCIRKSDAHGRFPITINYIPEGKKKHWPLA